MGVAVGAFTVTVAVVEVVTQVGGGPLDADDVMDVIWLAVVVVVVHAYAGETATAERASMRKNILRSVIGLDVQLLYLRKSTGHYFVSVVTNLKATDAKLDHPPKETVTLKRGSSKSKINQNSNHPSNTSK